MVLNSRYDTISQLINANKERMTHILSSHTWTSLSPEQRSRIRALFKIPRTGSTDVNDGRIVSDGTTPQDLSHLTIEKMQTYLSEESTDFHKLFDKVLARIQDEIEGKPIEPIINANPIQNVKKSTKKSKQE